MRILVKVPATTANLGPGFDALGLALDLWNEATFELADDFSVYIEGEGDGKLHRGKHNLIIRSALKLAERVGKELPRFVLHCLNRIPSGGGFGSSAAATLTGLLAANTLTRSALSEQEILSLATQIEGHPDNVAPALMGGLVASTMDKGKVVAQPIPIGLNAYVTVVLPNFHLSTKEARAALPKKVLMKDAVHNISRAILVAEAFRNGDFDLLGKAMTDVLHQPYRLKLIPSAESAIEAAKQAGASAVALSGAGPGLIAFSSKPATAIGEAAQRAFAESGLDSRVFKLKISRKGAEVHRQP